MSVMKYTKEYEVRSYECDKHKNLRILTLMNIFQDIADSNADKMGVGYDYCVSHNLAWVAANYHVKILRSPKLREKITINSWPSEERKLAAIRDYEIIDEQKEVIVQASTQWVLIDFNSKRPQLLRAKLPQYEVLNEKADNFEFSNIALPENFDFEKDFVVRFDDIDVNNHVNNAVYPLWLSETVDDEFRNNHTISEIEISFKKEIHAGEVVKSKSSRNGLESIHSIISMTDGREAARAVLKWNKV